MKRLVFATLLAFGFAASAQAYAPSDRNPTVYNLNGNKIGVIQLVAHEDGQDIAVLSPAILGTMDLGYHDIAVPVVALQQRPQGGWIALSQGKDVPPV